MHIQNKLGKMSCISYANNFFVKSIVLEYERLKVISGLPVFDRSENFPVNSLFFAPNDWTKSVEIYWIINI